MMEGQTPPAASHKSKYTHTHTHTTANKMFPKMPILEYMNTLPLQQIKLISYNQNNEHILSHVPFMTYL